MTTALDDWAPEDSTSSSEQMSSARGMFPLGPVPELLFGSSMKTLEIYKYLVEVSCILIDPPTPQKKKKMFVVFLAFQLI